MRCNTDTVTAVIGSLAGVVYGCRGIGRRWIEKMKECGRLEE